MLRETFAGIDLRSLGRHPGGAGPVAHPGASQLLDSARADPAELLRSLDSSATGLTQAAAAERLGTYGRNEVSHRKSAAWYVDLARSFKNAFVILLLVLAVVSYLTGDLHAAIVIAAMVAISVILRFSQEHRANQAAARLQAMVRVTATVLRPGPGGTLEASEIPIEDLVPGDLIKLSAGDMVPADVRLLSAKDVFVTQGVLTGESLPVEKGAVCPAGTAGTPLEIPNLCFMGTAVVTGSATAAVLTTGRGTYLGSIASTLATKRPPTSFERGINSVSLLLIRFMGVMTVVVFLINGFTKGDWRQAFFFALAVAVGLTPELLPMIVSGTLAAGAVAMAKKKVIVKQLNSIQNFGAMDVLCTDKTGTLTQDRVALERYCDVTGAEDRGVLERAYWNSKFQTCLKNLLDKAVLEHQEVDVSGVVKVDEIPFDFERRIMTVVVDAQGKRLLVAKGAPEAILARCSTFDLHDQLVPIEQLVLPDLEEELQALAEEGFRVLAVAEKEVPKDRATFGKEDERDLVLLGYVAFLDPVKESSAQAVEALHRCGVVVKVLTGDHEIIARKVCSAVGLDVGRVVGGPEVEAASDEQLGELVEATTVFARLTPAHKERVIRRLQLGGHVVGYLGDGINDAPALHAADVGISVDTAVDIAKESADLILLEKDLRVLQDGVLEGRRVFGNITKYIRMSTSSNFGNMFSVLGASALLPFLPMQPLQILMQNLLYDFSQMTIPFDRVDEEYLLSPRPWRVRDISRFMLFMGPVSSLFDYATFGLMFFYFGAKTPAQQALFQSGWFVEGLLSQTLIVHLIRTWKIPFVQSRAAVPLVLSTAAVMAIGVALPYSPFAHWMGLVALPWRYFPWLAAILLGYASLAQVVKTWFHRRYGAA